MAVRENCECVCLYVSDMQRYDCAMSWQAHSGEVYSVEFSYDENSVYSIGEDGKVLELLLNTELGPFEQMVLLERW